MRKNRRTIALLLACLLLTACGKNDPIPTETSTPIETTAPAETVSQSPEAMGLDGLTVQTAEGLADVTCEETEEGMRFTSANPAGQMQDILLCKEMETVYGHYYEMVYRFTSNTAGTVRFSGEGAAYYESNEFEVKEGENELVVRFAAGKAAY